MNVERSELLAGIGQDALWALIEGRHGDPFSILGPHQSGGMTIMRVYLPGAEAVDLIDATMEAVDGAASLALATGSAFCGKQVPSASMISNLYLSPGARRGTNSSQTPADGLSRIGLRRPSQALKSPTTETRRAFGAHTAKRTPDIPSIDISTAPSVRLRL